MGFEMFAAKLRGVVAMGAIVLLLGACGDSDTTDEVDGSTPATTDAPANGESNAPSDTTTDEDDSDPTDEGPDNDDGAEIVGQTTLPEAAEELLDDIDDIVSLGDCESDVVGLGLPAPDGWMCRVLDTPVGGLDGFTLFTSGNTLNITIGTPSGFGAPCELLGACDAAEAIALSDNFPDTMSFELAGTVTIWGTYVNSDAELVITSVTALSDDELDFVSQVLDSVVELS